MRSSRWIAVGVCAAAVGLSLPAIAFTFGEIRHEAAAGAPPLPPPPQEPTNLKILVEALTRVRADEARLVTGLGIPRHRVQGYVGLTPAQLATSALDISFDRGATHIADFRAVFGGLLPDADNIFENQNGQNVRFASWEIVRRSNGAGLTLDEGGTGNVLENVPGFTGIPLVQTGDTATFKVLRFAGTPQEVVTRSHTVTFD